MQTIEPVVRFAIDAVNCARYRVIVDAEPTGKSEGDFDDFSAARMAQFQPQLVGVGAVSADAVTITNQKSNDWIVHVGVESRRDSHRQRRTRLDNLRPAAVRID